MDHEVPLRKLPDDELLRRLAEIVAASRRSEAEIVAHIAEVDARGLCARQAWASTFRYCTEVLHFSEAEAFFRIKAARASREHPVLLAMLADGRLNLSAAVRLAPHLTAANREAVLARAVHCSKRQIEELIAELAPRADAPALMRKLPERSVGVLEETTTSGTSDVIHDAERPIAATAATFPAQQVPEPVAGSSRAEQVPEPVAGSGQVEQHPAPVGGCSGTEEVPAPVGGSHLVDIGLAAAGAGLDPASAPRGAGTAGRLQRPSAVSRRATIEPLSPGRYKVQFTVSAALREKLERLQALLCDKAAPGDLAAVIEQAVTEKLERLEARRFGRTKKPRRCVPEPQAAAAAAPGALARHALPSVITDREPQTGAASKQATMDGQPQVGRTRVTRHIPAEVRRAVADRDAFRCSFTDAQGRRCGSRERLEFHHRYPYSYGAGHTVRGIGLLCWTHHRQVSEADFGRRSSGKPHVADSPKP